MGKKLGKKLHIAESGRAAVVVFDLGDGRFSTLPRWKKDRTGEKVYTATELMELERSGAKVVRLEVHDWRK